MAWVELWLRARAGERLVRRWRFAASFDDGRPRLSTLPDESHKRSTGFPAAKPLHAAHACTRRLAKTNTQLAYSYERDGPTNSTATADSDFRTDEVVTKLLFYGLPAYILRRRKSLNYN